MVMKLSNYIHNKNSKLNTHIISSKQKAQPCPRKTSQLCPHMVSPPRKSGRPPLSDWGRVTRARRELLERPGERPAGGKIPEANPGGQIHGKPIENP